MDDYKENEVLGILKDSFLLQPATPKRPLSTQSSTNSLNGGSVSPVKVESMSPVRHLKYKNLMNSYNRLERQYADLLIKNSSMMGEFQQLQQELDQKKLINEQQRHQLSNAEIFIKRIEGEYSKNTQLYEKEISYYKEIIDELQDKIKKLTDEMKSMKELADSMDPDLVNKYHALQKEYKVFQSKFELEQNSKIVLIDHIEYLTKENELLKDKSTIDNCDGQTAAPSLDHEGGSGNSIVCLNGYTNTMNDLSEDSESCNAEYANNKESPVLHSLAEDMESHIESSSPIKSNLEANEINNFEFPETETQDIPRGPSLESALNYQFPPSPDPSSTKLKRQSLPVRLKHNSSYLEADDFVLSPLKLTNNNGAYFNLDHSGESTGKKHSVSKTNHSRYNSHDILPIKVEFEPLDRSFGISSSDRHSVCNTNPTSSQPKFESIDETKRIPSTNSRGSVRSKTFDQLNGYNNLPSNRSSLNTMESSKKSSIYVEESFMTNEMTKQEIMKLKFELQSLKLHNEKLLSYIGFELQKQNKNIKKLSHKKSMPSLKTRKIEYSDAKLIEKSRDVLIHKKRVLRSVSVNPPLPKKNEDSGISNIFTKGLIPHTTLKPWDLKTRLASPVYDDDSPQPFQGPNGPHDEISNDVLSKKLDEFVHIDDLDDDYFCGGGPKTDVHGLKKFQSQIFRNNDYDSSFDNSVSFDDGGDDDDKFHVHDDDEWEDIDDDDLSFDATGGIFSQLRWLISGSNKNQVQNHDSFDDGLKYKFLSIAIGIMIIGLRCADHANAVTSNK